MNKKVIYFILIFFSSCKNFYPSNPPIGRVNDKIIYMAEIDSIVSNNVRENQILALNSIVELEWQQVDSNKNKSNIENSGLSTNDHIPDIDFFIPPNQYNYKEIKKLNSYDRIIEDAKNTLIIIFNYDCPFCNIYDAEIRSISDKYKMNLKYIYFTDYVSMKALLCDAAKKQNKYWEVHDLIIDQDINDYSELLSLAHFLELDTLKVKKDIENPELIKSHLKNRDILLKMGIESVPLYIIKNVVFHDPKSIELLLQKDGKI